MNEELRPIMVTWSISKYLFKSCCAAATFVLLTMGLYRYLLDNDASVVDTRYFFQTDDDMFPVMSICFEQSFDGQFSLQGGRNINISMYKQHLLGIHFDEDLNLIDYHNVTTNISNYIIAHSFTYRNGTHIRGTRKNISWKDPYHTYSWNSWGRFVKCFGIEITDKELYHLAIYLKRSLFTNGIRPQSNGFVVLFHYPGQILSSLRQWTTRDNTSNYWTEFDVKNVDVIARRHKRRLKNCIEDWKNYDSIMMNNHFRSVGCKTPDQSINGSWPICSTKEKMREAHLSLKPGAIRPCREVEAINYLMHEAEGSPQHLQKSSSEFQLWLEKNLQNVQTEPNGDSGWFSIVLRILDPAVKTTINKREMDIESFVAYAGGYIGLFCGFSLAELPEVLYFTLFYYRKLKQFIHMC